MKARRGNSCEDERKENEKKLRFLWSKYGADFGSLIKFSIYVNIFIGTLPSPPSSSFPPPLECGSEIRQIFIFKTGVIIKISSR